MDTRVEAEIETLMSWINHDTGISNIFDHNRCLEMFQRLKATEVPFDPEEIRSKLVAKWKLAPKDAAEIKKMAEKIAEGKRVKKR
jgi:hypothetical protein